VGDPVALLPRRWLLTPAEKTFIEEPASAGAGGPGQVETPADELGFFTKRRMLQTAVIVTVLIVAIYVFLPQIADLESAFDKLGEADLKWVALAALFEVIAFGTYVALFRGVVGGDVLPLSWREAYEINMAGLAATRLFAAGGAGGIALTYWALRKAGMPRRRSACRMVAFLALQYIWYPLALIIFGVLLRTGVLPGESDLEVTIIPAAIAALILVLGIMVVLIPRDFERRIARFAQGSRRAGLAGRLASGPATVASGMRTALDLVRHPSQGGLAVAGAVGFWAANIAILWFSFKAFGVTVPLAVVVQGFFLGMLANLFPFAPGGVGAVDAGMIGAFLLFGLPEAEVFAAVLTYRVIAFWLPIPPGVVAFFQLRRTVARWQAEGRPADTEEATLAAAARA
jgi:putative heme transporter